MKKNLTDLRKEIDAIDSEIESLFVERMNVAKKIQELKKNNDLPINNSNRENEIKERILKSDNIVIRKYFPVVSDALIQVSKLYQNELSVTDKIYDKTTRICYFGKGKSNTYLGLKDMLIDEGYKQVNDFSFFKDDQQILINGSTSIDDLRNQLFHKDVDLAFVPFANSDMGVVMDTYRLLERFNFTFVAKTTSPIVLYLYTSKENNAQIKTISDIKCIYSNLAALRQCSDFINHYLPFAVFKKSISTTSSIDDMLNDKNTVSACFANSYANENILIEKVKFYEDTTSNNNGSKTTYLLLKRFESNTQGFSKKENIEDYFIGYYLYLSKNKKRKGFSVDAKSHRVVKIERINGRLELSVYIVSKEKNTWIAFSDKVRVFYDDSLRQICLEYEYRSAPGIKAKVNGLAYLRAPEADLQEFANHIYGEYRGFKNGKAGTLDYRRITKEEFEILMGNQNEKVSI